jgi:hypothetical protein
LATHVEETAAGVHRRFTCENGAVNAESVPRAVRGIVGGDFSDPTNERIIYMSALGLAVVGVALLVGTILWWRRGRQEHPVLAPLEVMSRRSWFKAPEGDRRRRLDNVRPAGSGAGAVERRGEPVDLQALVRSVPEAFDDLREPGEQSAVAEEGTTFAVDGEGEAWIVAEADEPTEAENVDEVEDVEEADVEVAEKVEEVDVDDAVAPVFAEPDATAVAIERPPPATDPSGETQQPPVEVFATGPNDSLK